MNKIWDFSGSFWGDFQDKDKIDYVWDALASGVQRLHQYVNDIQQSRIFEYMPSTIEIGPEKYSIQYAGSGIVSNVIIGSGIFTYPVEEWVYSIPTLTQYYKNAEGTLSKTYTQGVDYTISGYNSIVWMNVSGITWDARYPVAQTMELYAPSVLQLNPLLMNTWARALDFRYSYINQYTDYQNLGDYTYLRYLIWALTYKILQPPSIKTLRDSYAIAFGMPFAYNSGTLIYSTNPTTQVSTVTVGDDIYYLPSGISPIVSGIVEKFDIIAQGVSLYDNLRNPEQITGLDGVNALNRTNTLRYVTTVTPPHNSAFLDSYIHRILPIQQQFFIGTTRL